MDNTSKPDSSSGENSQNLEHNSKKEKCCCNLGLGIYNISSRDVRNSCEVEQRYNLVNQAIDFNDFADQSQRTTILKKIEKIKQYSSEYSGNKDVLAIPNDIPIHSYELVLDELSKKEDKVKLQADYLEDILHQKSISALQSMNVKAFVMKGFISGDCLKAKTELGRKLRAEQGALKNVAELNVHERDIMEILEITDIVEENLEEFIELHEQYAAGTLIKTNSEINKLYHKECFIYSYQGIKKSKIKLG